MTIYIFGNPDLPADSLPLRILPELKACFPEIVFKLKDPHEEWNFSDLDRLFVIDTAIGIKEIVVFRDLDSFQLTPRISMHDFDALTDLLFLHKLGKIKDITIVAIPSEIGETEATEGVSKILSTLIGRAVKK